MATLPKSTLKTFIVSLLCSLVLTCTQAKDLYNQTTHKELSNIKPKDKKLNAKTKTEFLITPEQCKNSTTLTFEKSALKTAITGLNNSKTPLVRFEQKTVAAKNKSVKIKPTTHLTVEFDMFSKEKNQFIADLNKASAINKNSQPEPSSLEKNVTFCIQNSKTLAKSSASTELVVKASNVKFYSK